MNTNSFKKLLFSILIPFVGMNAQAGEVTYSMTIDSESDGTNNVHWISYTQTSLSYNNVTWDISTYGTPLSQTKSKTKVQIGSGTNPAKLVTIKTDDFAGMKIKSASLTGYWGTKSGPALTIKAGSTIILDNYSLASSSATYTSTNEEPVQLNEGDSLVFTISVPSTVVTGVTISAIEVVYETVETSLSRTTATDKYGTICVPYTFSATGATIYSAALNDDKTEVTLTSVDTPVAGVPYIYQAASDAQTFTYSGDAVAEPNNTDNVLTGVFSDTKLQAGDYVMQTLTNGQKFYVVAAGAEPTLSANKAYIKGSDVSGAKSINIGFEDEEATAIKALDALVNGNAKIYDINGCERKTLQKGINIVNGTKIMVK